MEIQISLRKHKASLRNSLWSDFWIPGLFLFLVLMLLGGGLITRRAGYIIADDLQAHKTDDFYTEYAWSLRKKQFFQQLL